MYCGWCLGSILPKLLYSSHSKHFDIGTWDSNITRKSYCRTIAKPDIAQVALEDGLKKQITSMLEDASSVNEKNFKTFSGWVLWNQVRYASGEGKMILGPYEAIKNEHEGPVLWTAAFSAYPQSESENVLKSESRDIFWIESWWKIKIVYNICSRTCWKESDYSQGRCTDYLLCACVGSRWFLDISAVVYWALAEVDITYVCDFVKHMFGEASGADQNRAVCWFNARGYAETTKNWKTDLSRSYAWNKNQDYLQSDIWRTKACGCMWKCMTWG